MTEMRRVPVEGKKRRRPPSRDDERVEEAPQTPSVCDCPVLERSEWHEIESDWNDIAFTSGSVMALLGVPIGYADARTNLTRKALKAGAQIPEEPMFLLGSGRFRRRVLLEVEGVKRGGKGMVFPGGVAFSRLVEAPWGEMQRVVDETKAVALARYNRRPDDLFVWYLTCRQCSRERNFETLILAHYRTLA